MAIYPIACKEMATRRKNLYLWMLITGVGDRRLLCTITSLEGEFYGE